MLKNLTRFKNTYHAVIILQFGFQSTYTLADQGHIIKYKY